MSTTTICPVCSYPHQGTSCENPGCPKSGNVSREAWDAGSAAGKAEAEEREQRMHLYGFSFQPAEDVEEPLRTAILENSWPARKEPEMSTTKKGIEQSWEMTPEAAERNAKFATFANSAQGRAQERVCIKRALRAAGVEIPASILGDAAALRELADARGVTPYTWEQVKARNAHFAAVAALREVHS